MKHEPSNLVFKQHFVTFDAVQDVYLKMYYP